MQKSSGKIRHNGFSTAVCGKSEFNVMGYHACSLLDLQRYNHQGGEKKC